MLLQKFSIKQLDDLKEFILQLDEKEYSDSYDCVYKSSIGSHSRHIIEFYTAFFKGYSSGILCYDKRERDVKLEKEKDKALKKIKKIQKKLNDSFHEKDLILKLKINGESIYMPTTVSRELLYLMEHSTHHLAILRIKIQNIKPDIALAPDFGIAYSTPKK